MKLKILHIREPSKEMVHSPEAVAQLMKEEAKADRECMWVLHLTASNRIIEKELVSIGSVNNAVVHPREVFKKAILNGSAGIITIHNHPGGQAMPSREDRAIWEKLDQAGEILGIRVTDHLIVTPLGPYYSQKEGIKYAKGTEQD